VDSTTFIALIVVVIIIAAGIVFWLRRASSEAGFGTGERAAPPSVSNASPPTAGDDLIVDEEEKKQRELPADDEPVFRSGEGLFPAQDEAKPQAKPTPPVEVPAPASQPATGMQGAAPGSEAPLPTEDVRFTAFYPKEVAVNTWYTLLAYAHLDSVLAKVQADAGKFKEEMGSAHRESRSPTSAKLTRGTEITIVPQLDNVTFNPERITFKWAEDFHRAEFRFTASKDLAGSAGNGMVSIFVGPLIVGTIKLALLFEETGALPPVNLSTNQQTTTTMYKQEQIFVSYSHTDTPVVLACRNAYQALGYDVLIDVDDLRAGQQWNQALMGMIDRADIFQLFWSERSAQSTYVHQEWEYALQRLQTKGEGFIRPVYWEKPLPPPPPELATLHFAYLPLPSLTNTQDIPHH
jgi:hypothetical protein